MKIYKYRAHWFLRATYLHMYFTFYSILFCIVEGKISINSLHTVLVTYTYVVDKNVRGKIILRIQFYFFDSVNY